MNTTLENKVRKLERVSGWLRRFCLIWMALLSLFGVVSLFTLILGKGTLRFEDHTLNAETLAMPQRLMLAGGLVVTLGLCLYCAQQFRALLGLYRMREFFSHTVARHYRVLGLGSVAYSIASYLWLLMLRSASGTRVLTISLGFDTLLLGAALVAISWFVEMATELRKENELTV